MKKIIVGCLLLNLLGLEPIIGYEIFVKWLHIDSTPMVFVAVIFVVSAGFQLIFYLSLIQAGYREIKINTPFTQDQKIIDRYYNKPKVDAYGREVE
jgi:hypothetical protein